MSAGREKDQTDFDLEQIVKIIDSALESDDQRIKDALRALMTITVLCTAEHPDQAVRHGPLARVLEDMRHLGRRLSDLESEIDHLKQQRQFEPLSPMGSPYPNRPTPQWGPSWTSTDVDHIKTWSAGDDPNYKGSSAGTVLAEEFLKQLESK